MLRLIAIVLSFMWATAAIADKPRPTYSDAEYVEMMTAASYAGSLAFCQRQGIYSTQIGPLLFYKLRAHVVPLIGQDGPPGDSASAITEILIYASNQGRAGVFKHNTDLDIYEVAYMFDIRNVEDCRRVAEQAGKMIVPGRLLDNEVTVPDGERG